MSPTISQQHPAGRRIQLPSAVEALVPLQRPERSRLQRIAHDGAATLRPVTIRAHAVVPHDERVVRHGALDIKGARLWIAAR